MAYSTLSDVLDQIDEQKLIQLTDDANAGQVDAVKVERAIQDADEEIDGYVGSRHTVPLSPVPAIIRKYSVDLAVHNLYSRRDVIPEIRADRRKEALDFLKQVALGKISLGAHDPEGNPPQSEAPEFSTENPDRAFTRQAMRGF